MTGPVKACIAFLGAGLSFLLVSCSGATPAAIDSPRPKETVLITDEIRKRGYIGVGRMTIDKTSGKRISRDKTGYFDETNNPKR